MSNYKEQIAEFENNFSNVIDKSVRELSASFDILYSEKKNKEIPSTIKLAEALLSDKQNIATKMQIHYHVRITGINITKQFDNRRLLTVGRATKNELYWNAIECLKSRDSEKIAYVKGMQSFVLSVEKNGYENCYSEAMIQQIRDLGFASLKELIDSLN